MSIGIKPFVQRSIQVPVSEASLALQVRMFRLAQLHTLTHTHIHTPAHSHTWSLAHILAAAVCREQRQSGAEEKSERWKEFQSRWWFHTVQPCVDVTFQDTKV